MEHKLFANLIFQ